MAKIDYRKLRNELFRRTERYAAGVRVLYDQALADIAKEFANMDYDPSRVFSFDEVGKFDRVNEIMTRLESQIQQVVDKGIVAEFGQAYNGCNELIRQVVGKNISAEVAKAFMPRVASGNAAKVFIKANRAGNITASQRVWNGAALGQMETAVEEGLMEGMPAKRMAKLLEEYLVDPDSCFRRFRIKTGVDADGKSMYGRKWKKRIIHEDGSTTWKDADPRDYPVGSGVYHSSYKNALRYTRTTTNIAYRTADHDRYQDLPFVIGIEIKTSGNHPESDICDELAGEYPKDFLWVGWHPNCRCYQVPRLSKPDEVEKMANAILEGEDPESVPVEGRITDVPDNFKGWVGRNKERIVEAKRLPYFLRDNGKRDKQGVWHVKEFATFKDDTTKANRLALQGDGTYNIYFSYASDKTLFKTERKNTEKKLKSDGSISFKGNGIYSRHIYFGSDNMECVLAHAFDSDELSAALKLKEIIPTLQNGIYLPINTSSKNYKEKMLKRKIRNFIQYDVVISGINYVLKCKSIRNNGIIWEYPYSLKKKNS